VSVVDQLCLQCGLCCNGVLFDDVKLQRGDRRMRLEALGLKIVVNHGSGAFTQPCSCFDGKHCRIYAERPTRCRTFECTQIHRVKSGQQTVAFAKRRITAAQQAAEAVRRLCRELGNIDEKMALSLRYAEVMARPIDLSQERQGGVLRGRLLLAAQRLAKILGRDFLFVEATG